MSDDTTPRVRSPADILPGDWSILSEAAKAAWPNIPDHEIAAVEGRRDVLEDLVRRRYGLSPLEAARQVRSWLAGVQNPD